MTIRVILVLILLIIGCKRENGKSFIHKKKSDTLELANENFKLIDKNNDIRKVLPDTVSINESLKGYLIYKSYLDTIPTDSTDVRILFFYLANVDSQTKNYEKFRTKKSDTFTRIMDSIIPIFDIEFERKGKHLLEGFIMDQLFLDESNDSIRIKSDSHHVLHDVYVN